VERAAAPKRTRRPQRQRGEKRRRRDGWKQTGVCNPDRSVRSHWKQPVARSERGLGVCYKHAGVQDQSRAPRWGGIDRSEEKKGKNWKDSGEKGLVTKPQGISKNGATGGDDGDRLTGLRIESAISRGEGTGKKGGTGRRLKTWGLQIKKSESTARRFKRQPVGEKGGGKGTRVSSTATKVSGTVTTSIRTRDREQEKGRTPPLGGEPLW